MSFQKNLTANERERSQIDPETARRKICSWAGGSEGTLFFPRPSTDIRV
jgi:hypothetical protein